MKNLLNASQLPVPRLELRWEENTDDNKDIYPIKSIYNIVFPIGKYDCRVDGYDDDKTITTQMGSTYSTGKFNKLIDNEYGIEIPFRDGSHIAWDSTTLRLPAFVVCGDKAQFLEPRFD